ncbi:MULTISPECIES: hypothetical protein [Rhizobium]|uniref:Uncharacterized protein n=1 Tax=Rhizobium rhododendri TaxID=2506430 RepID=A0ABY8IL60_9HYPH|nr:MULTISPECIES: hypothetical protein [Rhizobium]MBO9098693.1 hypothetical protein [Rhizobium sp. L58/93]MBO9132502.1 hypothetical protein [Rhizobium sp. B209b/85]MBO9168959.1 hypothetical protein [Rhizobium sp. L245/93]MBO9184909.1 hypothetical protein [Rhizobium sp. E27B/91]MBZ5758322.1 hypothetical protein [Rhizobium sp. VS19-DR96]
MAMFIWLAIFVAVVGFGFYATRMVAQDKEESLNDLGLAILEFGRAFPTEAIRQLQKTRDGKALFVRLHDNKAGFMKDLGKHFACHVIEPGRARVRDAADQRRITIDFLDVPHHNGTYEFTSAKEAAEVSLWLLGNYVATDDLVLPEKTAANQP